MADNRPSRASKEAARQAINDSNPRKRKRLNSNRTPAAPTQPDVQSGHTVASATSGQSRAVEAVTELGVDDTGLSYSGINALVGYMNMYASREIEPARAIQKANIGAQNANATPEVQYPDGWTEEDESEACAMWQVDKDKWFLGKGVIKPYLKLFKICLQYAECTPWDIVGVRFQLRFQPEARDSASEMWSKPFCDALGPLLTHPVWSTQFRGSLAMDVALAIQYAIVLRTNDRRPWSPAPWRNDPFLKTLSQYANGTEPLRKSHERTRAYFDEIQCALPALSDVFASLETVVFTLSDEFRPSVGDSYAVTTKDLRNITEALDNMRRPNTGTSRFLPTDVLFETALSARPGRTRPSEDDLEHVHGAAMIEERRRLIVRRKAAALGPLTSSSDVLSDVLAPVIQEIGDSDDGMSTSTRETYSRPTSVEL